MILQNITNFFSVSEFCSQCSQLLGGISGSFLNMTATALEQTKDNKLDLDYEKLLALIDQDERRMHRLQHFDTESKVLWLCCGDGKKAVHLGSNGKLVPCNSPLRSKLSPEIVRAFRKGTDQIDGKSLFHEIEEIFKRYIYHEDEQFYIFLSSYVIASYLYSIFNHFGYLFVYSDKPRRGKTRVLEVNQHLTYEARPPVNSPSPAAMRDLASIGGAVQLDTLERWPSKESFQALMEILDAGFRKGGYTTKMVMRRKDWKREEVPVFAPYIMAGINKHSLSDTALDRSFTFEMQPKPFRILRTRYSENTCEKSCSPIRNQLYLWALQNAKKISELYESDEMEELMHSLGLNDRATDIWRPLFTIANCLELESELNDLKTLAIEMHQAPELAEIKKQILVLEVLEKYPGGNVEIVGTTTELEKHLSSNGMVFKNNELTNLLSEWGFEQRQSRKTRVLGQPRRAWHISPESLKEIDVSLRKRLPLISETPTTVTTNGEETKVDSV
jgi:hypothetical protein